MEIINNRGDDRVRAGAIIALSLILTGTTICAEASILGNETDSWSTDMGASTYFHHTTFLSDSVGNQTEAYIEYSPNENAKPVVVNGSSVWGTRSIDSAVSYMENKGLRTMAGINADYFSFKTGIPMGNVIIDGEIVSNGNEGQDAVAFRSDGSAFIDWFDLKTTLSNGETSVGINCINKWYQAGYDPIFMFTDKFGSSTHTESECLFLICTPVKGTLAIGENYELRVDDKFVYDGDITIPEGKVVLLIETDGIEECLKFLNNTEVGGSLWVTNNVADENNEKWSDVKELISSVGGRILMDGAVREVTDNQAAPRTAIGVKADGSVILYTLDGRQPGYSYGAQITTIAERLLELGCVNAINLDGGGSTAIGATFPGTDKFTVVNSPSDGSLRNVANFLFIRDDRKRTDIPWMINVEKDSRERFLSGMETEIIVESVYDSANYKIKNPDIQYEVVNYDSKSSVTAANTFLLKGTGRSTLSARSGEAVYERDVYVYENPDSISIYNEEDWKEIKSIYTEANEELQLNLSAVSYVGGNELNSYDILYNWSVEGDIGNITEDGIFTLADTANVDGKIIVTAGSTRAEIPVTIADYPKINPFGDTGSHWAKDILTDMYNAGIIKGVEDGGILKFYPDNDMTRAEFSSMICGYLGISTDKYADKPLDFTDSREIPLWAENPIKAVAALGVITGKSDDNGHTLYFAPNSKITRAEAMTVIGRCVKDLATGELSFADSTDVPEWAVPYVSGLLKLGIVNGYEDNTIRPNNNVRRAEAAAMLYKLMNN